MFRSALDALNMLARFRNTKVSRHMIDLGGDVTGNGIAKLVFTILNAVAEAERDRIRERIRDVKSDQKKRNRYLGGKVPCGYKLGANGELVAVQTQQKAIRRMISLRDRGESLRNIAAIMRESGHKLSREGVKKIIVAHRKR
jgi:DNA invertase Pin-like site-specific DNA recombinase